MLSLTLCCHLISYMSIHPCLNQRGLENDRLRSSPRSDVFKSHFIASMLHVSIFPKGSPSRGGDVAVYVFDINQLSLPTLFESVLVSMSVFMALSTVFHSINSPDNSPLSHFVLPVLFLPYWSFQLYISL